MLAATYVLPIRLADEETVDELALYLHSLEGVEIVVVDGSAAHLYERLELALTGVGRHVRPDPRYRGCNGKAWGALTGIAMAACPKIIVADDDVRYDALALRRILALLDCAEVVRPQNFFSPAPWHAILDGGRSLVNRALDGDWPGTLAFRRDALPRGYNADVLFENFELVRTIRKRGGREIVAYDVFVARRPPTRRHFFRQRVRQAYDEFARPARLAVALAILPLAGAALALRAWPILYGMLALTLAAALRGWMRAGAFRYFSILCVLAAPVWLLERGTCAWLALYQRLRFGGARYGDAVIAAASSSAAELRQWAS